MKTIILEGTNGAGKSRLAEMLSDRYGTIVIHAGGPTSSHAMCVKRCKEQSKYIQAGNYILDRTQVISYLVYQNCSDIGRRSLDSFIKEIKEEAIVIYCIGKGKPSNAGKAHYDNTLRLQILKEKSVLREKYNAIMENVPYILYDFKANNGFEELVKRIEE